jgi:hypothetical protein
MQNMTQIRFNEQLWISFQIALFCGIRNFQKHNYLVFAFIFKSGQHNRTIRNGTLIPVTLNGV